VRDAVVEAAASHCGSAPRTPARRAAEGPAPGREAPDREGVSECTVGTRVGATVGRGGGGGDAPDSAGPFLFCLRATRGSGRGRGRGRGRGLGVLERPAVPERRRRRRSTGLWRWDIKRTSSLGTGRPSLGPLRLEAPHRRLRSRGAHLFLRQRHRRAADGRSLPAYPSFCCPRGVFQRHTRHFLCRFIGVCCCGDRCT